jgi:hypothetical protein
MRKAVEIVKKEVKGVFNIPERHSREGGSLRLLHESGGKP